MVNSGSEIGVCGSPFGVPDPLTTFATATRLSVDRSRFGVPGALIPGLLNFRALRLFGDLPPSVTSGTQAMLHKLQRLVQARSLQIMDQHRIGVSWERRF